MVDDAEKGEWNAPNVCIHASTMPCHQHRWGLSFLSIKKRFLHTQKRLTTWRLLGPLTLRLSLCHETHHHRAIWSCTGWDTPRSAITKWTQSGLRSRWKWIEASSYHLLLWNSVTETNSHPFDKAYGPINPFRNSSLLNRSSSFFETFTWMALMWSRTPEDASEVCYYVIQ